MTEPSTPARRRARRAEQAQPDETALSIAADRLAAAEHAAAAEAAAVVASQAALPGPGDAPTGEPEREPQALLGTVVGGGFERVAAGSIQLDRGGIGEATADTVEVRVGGIGRLDATDVFVQFGGVGAARADVLNVEWGAVGPVAAGELRVTQGLVGSAIAREATIDQGFVRTLIAQHVTVTRPSAALVVLAARVDGEVRALLDWRGALALGVGLGLVTAVSRALRRSR